MEVAAPMLTAFFDLLSFLELRTLIITDIDTVKPNAAGNRKAVPRGGRVYKQRMSESLVWG